MYSDIEAKQNFKSQSIFGFVQVRFLKQVFNHLRRSFNLAVRLCVVWRRRYILKCLHSTENITKILGHCRTLLYRDTVSTDSFEFVDGVIRDLTYLIAELRHKCCNNQLQLSIYFHGYVIYLYTYITCPCK